jgi:hypothetical protein
VIAPQRYHSTSSRHARFGDSVSAIICMTDILTVRPAATRSMPSCKCCRPLL